MLGKGQFNNTRGCHFLVKWNTVNYLESSKTLSKQRELRHVFDQCPLPCERLPQKCLKKYFDNKAILSQSQHSRKSRSQQFFKDDKFDS